MSDVCIVGIGIHPFGRTPGASGLEQGVIAVRAALADAGVEWPQVRFAFGGSDAAGNPDTMVDKLGLTGIPFVNVKNGCATGGSALAAAVSTIQSGEADLGLAVGFDKHPRGAFDPVPADWGLPEWYGAAGYMVTTQFFAVKIRRYMALHGISPRTLARVAAKAFDNAVHAPHAWRRAAVSEDAILASEMVSDPLTKFMFCSPAEGAVALILASEAPRARARGGDDPAKGRDHAHAPATQLRGVPARDRHRRRRRDRDQACRASRVRARGDRPGGHPRRAIAGHRSRGGDHAHGRKRLLRRWRAGGMARRGPNADRRRAAGETPMAAVSRAANRLARRDCGRCTKMSCNCAVSAAGGRFREARAPPTATSTALPVCPPSPSWNADGFVLLRRRTRLRIRGPRVPRRTSDDAHTRRCGRLARRVRRTRYRPRMAGEIERARLAQLSLAGRGRRAGLDADAALSVRERDGARRCALSVGARSETARSRAVALRHRRTKGAPAAAHPLGRGLLVPGLLRTRLGIRSRQPRYPRRARGGALRRHRLEDLDHARASRQPHLRAGAHRSRRQTAGGDQLPDDRYGPAGCHRPPDRPRSRATTRSTRCFSMVRPRP